MLTIASRDKRHDWTRRRRIDDAAPVAAGESARLDPRVGIADDPISSAQKNASHGWRNPPLIARHDPQSLKFMASEFANRREELKTSRKSIASACNSGVGCSSNGATWLYRCIVFIHQQVSTVMPFGKPVVSVNYLHHGKRLADLRTLQLRSTCRKPSF